VRRLAAALVMLALALTPGVTEAGYPGENGRIAFVGGPGPGIWTVSPEGTNPVQLTNPPTGWYDTDPSWSPAGNRLAFSRIWTGGRFDERIYVINSDGTGEAEVTTNGRDPTWSPDGTEIAFLVAADGGLYRINADGTNRRVESYVNDALECCPSEPAWSPAQPEIAFGWLYQDRVCDPFDPFECEGFTNEGLGKRPLGHPDNHHFLGIGAGSDPDWSPNGAQLAHVTARIRIDWYTSEGVYGDIAVVNRDGSSPHTIVAGPQTDVEPAWSPDGAKIVFVRRSDTTGPVLWVANADGSSAASIGVSGSKPDWQPKQRAYARPAAAGPLFASLVPAFDECTAPNRTHGPPLAHPSCYPPGPASPNLLVSAGETRLKSAGFMRLKPIVGAPGAPDDSDVRLRMQITNVMNASDLSDYTGVLRPEVVVRLTDRDGFQRQTTQDFPFGFTVPCAATADATEGAICNLGTSADAIVPGSVPEGSRSIWGLDQVRVYDGGPTGDGTDASLFAVQGVFVP
jgi:dipeptidyl aminopeptidase/acylaminoacyl peptidase